MILTKFFNKTEKWKDYAETVISLAMLKVINLPNTIQQVLAADNVVPSSNNTDSNKMPVFNVTTTDKTDSNGQMQLQGHRLTVTGQDGSTINTLNALQHVLDVFRTQILFFFAIAILAMLVLWIHAFTQLSASGSNPQKRQSYLNMLLFCFIGTMGLGSVAWIAGVAYSILHD